MSLREMRETNYWLRLIKEISNNLSTNERKELDYLIDESEQLTKILGAIVVKVKKKI
ncbi:MAG: hypothetical protein L3J31_01210 [Bacteroidales bacterium]|nr:hypothetical protein [Bacteroidales bacterium]MCF6341408.1 hypothetical protein [Bacteroidales bacterium]